VNIISYAEISYLLEQLARSVPGGKPMDSEAVKVRVQRFGHQALWLAAVNAVVVVAVFLWCMVVEWEMADVEPSGLQFAAKTLPIIIAGGLVVLPLEGAGAVMAGRGLIRSLRTPGRPALRPCVIGLVLHAGPPVALVVYLLAMVTILTIGPLASLGALAVVCLGVGVWWRWAIAHRRLSACRSGTTQDDL